MKVLLISSLLFLSLNSFADHKHINVKVKGMVCAFCVNGVEKKFGAREEVSSVKVDMDTNNVHIELKDGKILTDEKITELITAAGFNVAGIERDKH